MRARALFAAFLVVLAATFVLFERPAAAQQLAVNRVTGNQPHGSPGTIGVNRQDCVNGINLTFSLAITNLTGTFDLQVWAGESGADCTDLNNRSGTNVARCRQVAPSQRTTSATFQIDVSARDLAANLSGPPQPASYEAATVAACDVQTTESARTLGVYFLLMNGTNVVASTTFKATGAAATTGTTTTQQDGVVVDLLGPSPPSDVRTATGDRRLRVDWTPTGDRDVKGYVFYCQRASDATSDAGTSATTTTTTRECPDSGDLDGSVDACVETTTTAAAGGACAVPEVSKATECGRLIQTGASSGNTDRVLDNDVGYAVAVAAIDAFDNVGKPASATQCGVPQAVADFWREYGAAGGQASGFCAIDGRRSGSNLFALALGATFVLWVARARRRRP
ncbi:MAG: hypothetical protein IPG50_36460 [Myxococcales bacterium]|nr:hypothetical protein [Myxococcales bacterium]